MNLKKTHFCNHLVNTLEGPDTSNEELYEIMDEKGLSCLDEVYEYLTKQYEKDRENE